MALVTVWPILVFIAALTGTPTIAALVTVLPLGAGLIYLFGTIDPVLAVLAAQDERLKKAWEHVRTIIVAELTMGAYLTFVPIKSDPTLIAQLALLALILLFSGNASWIGRAVPKLAFLLFIVLTFVLLLGGREKAGKLWDDFPATFAWLSGETPIVLTCENGYLEAPLGTTWYLVPKMPCMTKVIHRPVAASSSFYADAKDNLLVYVFFGDGREPPLVEFSPVRRILYYQGNGDYVTGFRFLSKKSNGTTLLSVTAK